MAEPTLDSLSANAASLQPSSAAPAEIPPAPAQHIEMPPIGPAAAAETDALGVAPPPPETQPIISAAPADSPMPSPSSGVPPAVVAQPVIETHKGSVPVMPLPGQAAQPAPPASRRGEHPLYLWILLLVGALFLALLFYVYFGGVYQAS